MQGPARKPDISVGAAWLRTLACLAVVVLACGLKNYLLVLVTGTAFCPYLCSSPFRTDLLFAFPFLESLFETQRWLQEGLQGLVDTLYRDPWNLSTSLIFAPLSEELIYRGPMFLTRGFLRPALWWPAGILLALLFALSHGRNGLPLLPLLVLGVGSLWLIATTNRFWPAVVLHFLHNFFFSSALVYHSASFGD